MKITYTLIFLLCCVFGSRAQSASVYFASGSAKLTGDTQTALQKIMRENKADISAISIMGYADTVGNSQANQNLSERRARAIQSWFLKNGVKPNIITIAGKGETNDRTVFSENRRCDISITNTSVSTTESLGPLTILFTITDNETGQPLPAEVKFTHLDESYFTTLEANGKKDYVLEYGENYTWEFSMEGYESRTFNFNPSGLIKKGRKEFTAGISLVPQKIIQKITVEDIYFVGNSDQFLETSKPGLERLYTELIKVQDAIIEIHGHVNYPMPFIPTQQKEEELMALSIRRAQAVFNYLSDKGIDSERMRFKGFGHRKMVYPNAQTEEEQQKNRRVEILILAQ